MWPSDSLLAGPRRPRPLHAPLVPLFAIGALSGCEGVQSALDPAGPAAGRIAVLWWAMLVAGTIVSAIVLALTAHALFRRRERGEGDPLASRPPSYASPNADRRSTRLILIGGGIIPALILIGVFVLSIATMGVIIPPRERPDLVVEVVGRQWWWHVRYLDATPSNVFVTANELRIPVGGRVEVRLLSEDVIHSFWVPSLQGKLDLIPGRRNVTWLQADEPGVYRGQCAEYCGLQHARMAFTVVAMQPPAFEAWLANQRTPAPQPVSEPARRGRAAFIDAGCALCHTIRGTSAGGVLGPDLTHIASRLTLASGTLPNTKGHLGGWISNPQELKPGVFMPRLNLGAAELRTLLEYLMTLR